ncbi:MAG: ribonuclease P protein component [Asticcacaulis sp.]
MTGDTDPVSPVVSQPMKTLTRRAEFLAASKAESQARGAVVVQARARLDDSAHIGIGYTATRKIGGAVIRNRAKRRLREAARSLLPHYGIPGHDYVFIARAGTPDRDWPRLLDDVKSALIRLGQTKPGRTQDKKPSQSE